MQSAIHGIAVRPGEHKCGGSDHSSGDSSDDGLPPHWKILGARPSTVTGLTGDSSNEVSNWPVRIGTLADTDALAPTGIVRISSVNPASSRLSNTANLQLVEHIEFRRHPGRVKWTKHTGFLDAY